jgi:hypothetical protein
LGVAARRQDLCIRAFNLNLHRPTAPMSTGIISGHPGMSACFCLRCHVRFWHLADMVIALSNVRYWGVKRTLTTRCSDLDFMSTRPSPAGRAKPVSGLSEKTSAVTRPKFSSSFRRRRAPQHLWSRPKALGLLLLSWVEGRRLNTTPSRLARLIIETVLADDLLDAVLDGLPRSLRNPTGQKRERKWEIALASRNFDQRQKQGFRPVL